MDFKVFEPLELRYSALQLLQEADIERKQQGTIALWQFYQSLPKPDQARCWPCQGQWTEPDHLPGRPDLPVLVPPKQVPSRNPAQLEGRCGLLHAITHIEFNAINLALDAIWRFADMPAEFYQDWLQVAAEEALHFNLLRQHLQKLGSDYGQFEAHDGLWQMTQRTAHDIVARMALVPRTLEARGLDATPPIQRKLAAAGDHEAVAILDIILRDEIGHVAIGNRWYGWLCQQRGLDPVKHYRELVRLYAPPRLRSPINWEAREAAGFSEDELAFLRQEVL